MYMRDTPPADRATKAPCSRLPHSSLPGPYGSPWGRETLPDPRQHQGGGREPLPDLKAAPGGKGAGAPWTPTHPQRGLESAEKILEVVKIPQVVKKSGKRRKNYWGVYFSIKMRQPVWDLLRFP